MLSQVLQCTRVNVEQNSSVDVVELEVCLCQRKPASVLQVYQVTKSVDVPPTSLVTPWKYDCHLVRGYQDRWYRQGLLVNCLVPTITLPPAGEG